MAMNTLLVSALVSVFIAVIVVIFVVVIVGRATFLSPVTTRANHNCGFCKG